MYSLIYQLRCTYCLITYVSKSSWGMIISEFSQAEKIIPCPRTIICNSFEQINLLSDIFNPGDNVNDQEDYGFRDSF